MTNEFTVVKTAAVAVLDANLFEDEKWKSVSYPRKISAVGVVGSTSPQDFAVELWAGEARKGVFYNTSGGANIVPDREDIVYVSILIPGGQELQCRVVDAAAANAVAITVRFDSAPRKRRFGFQRYNSRIRNPVAYNAAIARNQGRRY